MRIAVFGGTFDPVHIGHIEIVKAILDGKHADKIIVLPAWEPPHKKKVNTPYCHRLKMAEIAFEGIENVEVSDMESKWCFEPSYSLKVLNAFQQLYPDDTILMVIGGDSLKNFSSWHKPQELAERFGFIIYPRCNEDCDFAALSSVIGTQAAEKMQKNVINAPFFEISSTILRKKLANSENTANFITEEVLKYIKENKLY
ncbi:MAG: nicotinate (nicotinamide) nucleotide adenylyltransferase [Lentisphaeria bacterium]|nr:nicotinate (nicotinamide) nucleotide adenylyltransferase [Lentisphaeria bacterium]